MEFSTSRRLPFSRGVLKNETTFFEGVGPKSSLKESEETFKKNLEFKREQSTRIYNK